ncbi:MAG TPA: GNAT family N-acetyltransferase [Stellaceae bacterium]|nr:GNAT family N-acetyltransferase [Stellaceae bacterium]
MQSGERTSLEWRGFADLSAALLYEVLRFRQAIFVVEQASPYPDLDGLDQAAQHLLLRIDDGLAGYLRLIPCRAEARVAIGRVAVAAEMRRRGIARRLMAEALARCRNQHPGHAIVLTAQTYLAPFYEEFGFRATGTPYDDYGLSHVAMALEEE